MCAPNSTFGQMLPLSENMQHLLAMHYSYSRVRRGTCFVTVFLGLCQAGHSSAQRGDIRMDSLEEGRHKFSARLVLEHMCPHDKKVH